MFEVLIFSKFKLSIVQTKSDREMKNTKVVDIDELYNFVVDKFFIWNHYYPQNLVQNSCILKFKFWTIQTKSDGEMTKTNIVYISMSSTTLLLMTFSFKII
jgi:hypothetical protein